MKNKEVEKTIIECGLSIGLKEVYGLCSGGKDSMSAVSIFAEHSKIKAVLLVDTTIVLQNGSHKPSYEASESFAKKLGVPFICIRPLDSLKVGFEYVNSKEEYGTGKTFENYCKKYGFPHAGQHNSVFRYLKKKAMVAFVRSRTKPKERIGFVSGVRCQESKRRLENSQMIGVDEDTPRIIWIAPIFNWTTNECFDHIKENNYERSKGYDVIGLNGDCLCGAYASKEEIYILKKEFPDTFEKLKYIESVAYTKHKGRKNWGNGASTKDVLEQKKLSEKYTCSECSDRCPHKVDENIVFAMKNMKRQEMEGS